MRKKYDIQREGHVSLRRFSPGFSILVELYLKMMVFFGGRKTRVPGEKTSEPGENQQQSLYH